MRLSATFRASALVFTGLLWLVTTATAAEVRVMISGGLTAAYNALVPEFERATGHTVIVRFEAGPSLMQKVNVGAPADLVMHDTNWGCQWGRSPNLRPVTASAGWPLE